MLCYFACKSTFKELSFIRKFVFKVGILFLCPFTLTLKVKFNALRLAQNVKVAKSQRALLILSHSLAKLSFIDRIRIGSAVGNKYTRDRNVCPGLPVYEVKCLCSRGQE